MSYQTAKMFAAIGITVASGLGAGYALDRSFEMSKDIAEAKACVPDGDERKVCEGHTYDEKDIEKLNAYRKIEALSSLALGIVTVGFLGETWRLIFRSPEYGGYDDGGDDGDDGGFYPEDEPPLGSLEIETPAPEEAIVKLDIKESKASAQHDVFVSN